MFVLLRISCILIIIRLRMISVIRRHHIIMRLLLLVRLRRRVFLLRRLVCSSYCYYDDVYVAYSSYSVDYYSYNYYVC